MPTEAEVIGSLVVAQAPVGLNDDQKLIWEIFEKSKVKALKKNLAYGSSVFIQAVVAPDMPMDAAIRVRMSDKINRIKTLLADPKKNMINDESIDDTFDDLGVYCYLYLIAKAKMRAMAISEAQKAVLKPA